MENFNEKLESFVQGASNIRYAAFEKAGYLAFSNPTLVYSIGKRYVKVIEQNMKNEDSCVFCFIDATNGDVLKSASWKAPAKGARGNIFDEHNGLSRITPQGAEYNR